MLATTRAILAGFSCGVLLLGFTHAVAFFAWPPCTPGYPCEEPQSKEQLERSFARAVVPILKGVSPDFSGMGKSAFTASNTSDEQCIAAFAEFVEKELGGFVSRPLIVQRMLDLMGAGQLLPARRVLGGLLTEPHNFSVLVRHSITCAAANPMLAAYACSVSSSSELRRFLIRERDALMRAAHLYLVLEMLASASRDDAALTSEFLTNYERLLDETVRRETSGKLPESLRAFRLQKTQSLRFHGVEAGVKANPLLGGRTLHYKLMLNILEATALDHQVGMQANVALGLALAASVSSQWPSVDSKDRLTWRFGKSWIDAYVAWNLNFVGQLRRVEHFSLLLVPSVLCTPEHSPDNMSRTDGSLDGVSWVPPPVPDRWLIARVISLQLMAITIGNFPPSSNGGLPALVREQWASLSLQHTTLPRPRPCCGLGSLREIFETVLSYNPAGTSPTSEMSDEWFVLNVTVIQWLMLMVTGFGSELALGVGLLHSIQRNHVELLWTLVQLFNPISLTIALYSKSAFGLPFLWFGLWKGGFPESTASFVASAHDWQDGFRMLALLDFLNGVGTILHHATTSFIIMCVSTGLFPLSRPMAVACLVPVMQHAIVPMKLFSRTAFTSVALLLEVLFEWEVLVNIGEFTAPAGSDFTRLGRVSALAMLVSHWLYLLGGTELLLRCSDKDKDEDEGHHVFKSRRTSVGRMAFAMGILASSSSDQMSRRLALAMSDSRSQSPSHKTDTLGSSREEQGRHENGSAVNEVVDI